jgi:hypothetical protein
MRRCHEFFNNTSKPTGLEHIMLKLTTPRHAFLQDRQGRKFADVPSDSEPHSTLSSISSKALFERTSTGGLT